MNSGHWMLELAALVLEELLPSLLILEVAAVKPGATVWITIVPKLLENLLKTYKLSWDEFYPCATEV